MTARSWEKWTGFFAAAGYECLAPAWPRHGGEPAELRANVPPGTGDLILAGVLGEMERVLARLDERPILIGHSIGGLVVQVLVNRGLAAAGVCISPVAPNAMLSWDCHFLRSMVPILNPMMGDAPQEMTPKMFHETFANCLTEEESLREFERYAVHESRNVLRTALGKEGHVDLKKHHVPLLFISGREDHIIPEALVERNFDAYGMAVGTKSIRLFAGRGHHICNEPGWQEVAGYVESWLSQHGAGSPWLTEVEKRIEQGASL
ncbi:alpha/beta fold hydrolase [soil metagenome]